MSRTIEQGSMGSRTVIESATCTIKVARVTSRNGDDRDQKSDPAEALWKILRQLV